MLRNPLGQPLIYIQDASKVSLSSLSSQELWERSGRLKEGSEVGLRERFSCVGDWLIAVCRCLSLKIEKGLAFCLLPHMKKRLLHLSEVLLNLTRNFL